MLGITGGVVEIWTTKLRGRRNRFTGKVKITDNHALHTHRHCRSLNIICLTERTTP